MTSNKLRSRRILVSTAMLPACLLFISAGLRAQTAPVCAPSAAVQAALDQLPTDQTPDQTDYQFRQARRSALQLLMQQYPNDVFIQRAYIRNMSYRDSDLQKVTAEYKALHEQHPDDPQIAYLYALTLVGRDSPQAAKLLSGAIEKSPDFPLPNLELVAIETSPRFTDKADALEHVKAFLTACPAAFAGYDSLTRMDGQELAARSAAQLRKLVEPRTDPDALGEYSTLWALEFKGTPAADYPALRKQVSADVARLRSLNLEKVRQWWSALEDGYKLTNDQKQSDWAQDQSVLRFPSPYNFPGSRQWNLDHPSPADDAPAEARQAYYTALLAHTADVVKLRPNTGFVWLERLDAMEHVDDVPAAEIESTIDQALKVAQANAGPEPIDSDTYFSIAEILSKKELQPERQVEMARLGLKRLEDETKQPYYDLYATKENLDDYNFYTNYSGVQGVYYEADGYLRIKHQEQAQLALTRLDEKLQTLKSLVANKDSHRKSYDGQESNYWGAMARFAELQNRKLDAMAYYQDALLARLHSAQLPSPGEKDPVLDGARKLWASLGGTDEGWNMWYGRRANALANQSRLTWETAQEPLPAFKLTDIHGKTWQLADLKGKVVFLNFWASW
jgi:hypothetical protein